MRAICTYARYTKSIPKNWDIKLSVTVKVLLANISWTTGWTYIIELVLESAHQTVSDDISYIIVISIHRNTSISI